MATLEVKYTDIVLQRMPDGGRYTKFCAGMYCGTKFQIGSYGDSFIDVAVFVPGTRGDDEDGAWEWLSYIPGTEQPIGTWDEAIDAAVDLIDNLFTIS